MKFRRQAPWVVLVAVSAGFVLARGAIAQIPLQATQSPPPKPIASPSPSGRPAASEAHDESEPEERHTGAARPSASTGTGEGDPGNPSAQPAASAKATVLRVAVPAVDGMLRIPGGKFIMASSFAKNQPPPRPVTLAPFWVDRNEVNVAEYRACVAKGACARTPKTSASCTFDLGDPQLPISCVHWSDAETYCRSAGKRLPSEVEWEYAARGNLGTVYPWGGGISCNFAVTLKSERTGQSCSLGHPDHVGARLGGASMFGVLDMSGNVEEWTADWYVEHLGRGPAPRQGASHVLRGGGWLSAPSMSRTTTRNWGSAVEAGPNVGFRCAKDAAL
jgi:formylglycine-generating enzyme required for sulfatase activity